MVLCIIEYEILFMKCRWYWPRWYHILNIHKSITVYLLSTNML